MEIPRLTPAHRSSLDHPEIYIQGSNPTDRYRSSSRSSNFSSRFSPTTSSTPMAIPNTPDSPPPPPLPPPRLPNLSPGVCGGPDIAWRWSNSREAASWLKPSLSVNPGSSLIGNYRVPGKGFYEETPEYTRPGNSSALTRSMADDEGYASLSSASIGSNLSKLSDSFSSRTRFQSSVHEQFQSNVQAYDKSLIQKLDSRRRNDNSTPPRGYPKSPLSSSLNDASPTSMLTQEQKPFSMPVLPTRIGSMENPLSRWDCGTSTTSPLNVNENFRYRSPTENYEAEKSPRYDHIVDADPEFPMEETSVLRRLHLDDGSIRVEGNSTTGQKRRASSPLEEEAPLPLHTAGSASDLFRRRDSASRSSPTPRFHPSQASASSTASGPRNSSYTSISLPGSSMSTMSSYGRLSPGGLSPGGVSPRSNDGTDTTYMTTPLTTSPRGSTASPIHRVLPERPSTARKSVEATSHTKRNSPSKLQGIFMCECCPKKPKKFEKEEDLNAHEMEKQYECQYCKNRFKNKNEAERHQNSLHLRRHSWSCAALSGFPAAFHSSPSRPTEADTCGYCGDEFPRSGMAQNGIDGKIPTDHDWEVRVQHLVDVHKFGECNQGKKFFRADHFRQHLKHSHAGTSGKWTNMLENACMKDEPLPDPLPPPITEEEE